MVLEVSETVNGWTESSNWSAKPKVVRVCRDSCGSSTESEKDGSCDPAHTRKDSPHLVSSRAVVQTPYVARRVDRLSELIAAGSVLPREVGIVLFPDGREP